MSIIVSHQTYASGVSDDDSKKNSEHVWNRLNDLTKLSKLRIIAKPEYEVRKQQLVDELTGTKIKQNIKQSNKGEGAVDLDPVAGNIPPLRDATMMKQSAAAGTRTAEEYKQIAGERKDVADSNFPDFSKINPQRAKMLRFNLEEGKFDEEGELVEIKIDPCPFARGNLRLAHHMLACLSRRDEESVSRQRYVAKISIDPYEDPKSYLDDVATQQCAREYAKMYNRYNPPKRVKFVEAFILSMIDQPRAPFCAVERHIDGTYKKHNNNWGFINNKHERNTPHAFSHFTFEASQHQLLICDIQGVGDIYTDPQIHSIDGRGYGKGNMGKRGFRKFFSTHKCNAICKFLKLPLINPKGKKEEMLTMPQEAFMAKDAVENVKLSFCGSFNALPTLPAFKNSTHGMKQALLSRKDDGFGVCCRCSIL